jgi:hypothetical protein
MSEDSNDSEEGEPDSEVYTRKIAAATRHSTRYHISRLIFFHFHHGGHFGIYRKAAALRLSAQWSNFLVKSF